MRMPFALTSVVLLLISYNPLGSKGMINSLGMEDEIIVSAAISLKDAFVEIGHLYEIRTGTKAIFNFGASGILQKQVESGAPVDVFASAGEKQMDELEAEGLVDLESRNDFARNTLVLVAPVDSELKLRAFKELDSPKVSRIAIGNPITVPAGQYAKQLLTNMKLWDKLQTKLIFAENVRQVLDYVTRGEVEAGIVYSSDTLMARGKVSKIAEAPQDMRDPILYPIAVIKESRQKAAAKHFIDFVLGSEGQSILRKYGFLSIK